MLPCLIINPASAAGRTLKRAEKILNAVRMKIGSEWTYEFTRHPGHATQLTRDAIARGSKLIIAVGGDGTIQEVVNGMLEKDRRVSPDIELAIISAGTGQGFAQSLGLKRSLAEQVMIAVSGKRKLVDVGKVVWRDGLPQMRYFVNECQFGIGGSVVQSLRTDRKWLGGRMAFGLETIRSVFRHRNQAMTVYSDGTELFAGPLTGVVVANGAFTGGGMNLAPGALVDDGLFNVLLMKGLSVPERLRIFPTIYKGRHLNSPKFSYHCARCVQINADDRVLVEADGELIGTAPVEVHIVPHILAVRVAHDENP